jgi:hypothetical protein
MGLAISHQRSALSQNRRRKSIILRLRTVSRRIFDPSDHCGSLRRTFEGVRSWGITAVLCWVRDCLPRSLTPLKGLSLATCSAHCPIHQATDAGKQQVRRCKHRQDTRVDRTGKAVGILRTGVQGALSHRTLRADRSHRQYDRHGQRYGSGQPDPRSFMLRHAIECMFWNARLSNRRKMGRGLPLLLFAVPSYHLARPEGSGLRLEAFLFRWFGRFAHA